MDEYRVKAHAKINLGLNVVKRLPDGYHQVRMIMQSIGLCDELTLTPKGEGLSLSTDSAELTTDESNLVCKAARLMLQKYHISGGIHVHLQKNIPIAAGLAGGSSDAAAVMRGINELFGLGLPLSRLMEDGVSIGADVPYCIMGGTALAEGIGEKLTSLPPLPDCHILLVKPDISVSTKYVYEHLDREDSYPHPDIDQMTQAVRAGRLADILKLLGNTLETVTAADHPVIASLKERMSALGAGGSLMSGSGPTVFGIFRDKDSAESARRQMTQENPEKQIFLTAPVSLQHHA